MLTSLSSASASTTDEWHLRAVEAYERFQTLDDGKQTAFTYASMAQLSADLYGWGPEADRYLAKVHATRNPDGGYGLGYPYDAFRDNTTNPATTTYTVTVVDHVGPVFLEAYLHGDPNVSREEIVQLVQIVLHLTKLTYTDGSVCFPYSNSIYDHKPSMCVHNVNAGTFLFFQQVKDAGIYVPGVDWYTENIIRHEVITYNPSWVNWLYSENKTLPNDADHNSLDIEAALQFSPPLGKLIMKYEMTHNRDVTSWLAHLRLAALDCADGTRWYSDFDNHINTATALRVAQIGKYAARSSLMCN